MKVSICLALTACLGFCACGGSQPSSPSPGASSSSSATTANVPGYLITGTPAGASTPCPTIGFEDVGAAAAPVTTYTRCGFTITATTSNWMAWTGYGRPAPFIGFMSDAGATTAGEIRVTAAAGKFTFQSVDIYSSTTPIPYVITGIANAATVFTLEGTQPNTFGNFATIGNPKVSVQIDALVIRLSNPAAPCCGNPMGLDNIVLK